MKGNYCEGKSEGRGSKVKLVEGKYEEREEMRRV